MGQYISPISIDFGAKNTGLGLFHYPAGEAPEENKELAFAGVVSFDENALTLSQTSRRAKRHQNRVLKRRKLAKRLFRDILKSRGIDFYALPKNSQEFLMGLFNRRGFSYLSEGLDEENLRAANTREINAGLGANFFTPSLSVLDQCLSWSRELKKAEDFLDLSLFQKSTKKERYKEIQKNLQKTSIASLDLSEKVTTDRIVTEIEALFSFAIIIQKSLREGHKHRSEYFKNIQKDIESAVKQKDTKDMSALLKKLSWTPKELSFLIGNISNLQLRVLRKYYNDESKKVNEKFQEERLGRLVLRWLHSLKPDNKKEPGSKERLQKLTKELKLQKNRKKIVDFFLSSDPALGIPPYENQNNRRTPHCQSLLLSVDGLFQIAPNWPKITEKLIEAEKDRQGSTLADIFEPPLKSIDRKQPKKQELPPLNAALNKYIETKRFAIKKKRETTPKAISAQEEMILSKEYPKHKLLALLLQRILDRSRKIDPYKLRLLCQTKPMTAAEAKSLQAASKALQKVLGNQSKELLKIARSYYERQTLARQGVWDPAQTSITGKAGIVEVCQGKPKLKKNMPEAILAAILGLEVKEYKYKNFVDFIKNTRLGRSTLLGICRSIEEERKKVGNAFAEYLKELQWRQKLTEVENSEKKNTKKKTKPSSVKPKKDLSLDKDEKRLLDLTTSKTEKAAEEIARFFMEEASENEVKRASERFANPFSLAQIYNVVEGDQSGFHKTCPLCTLENQWRSEEANLEEHRIANASRLPALSLRPFDGWIARLCEAKAARIARLKVQQLKESGISKKDELIIPVIIEQNAFSFTADLTSIKKSTKQKNAKKRLENAKENWKNKWERIKDASKNICPYTGKTIGKNGEIDHIIPRSHSQKYAGTVFNSEANLIYATAEGNRKKKDRLLKIRDLNPAYLKKQFGTNDPKTIEEQLSENTKNICEKEKVLIFDALDPREQRDLRHALFSSNDETRNLAFRLLQSAHKARVNGTQAYLMRALKRRLADYLQKDLGIAVHIEAIPVDAKTVNRYREILAQASPELAKTEIQAAGSHAVDAVLALAAALMDGKNIELLQAPIPTDVSQNTAEYLCNLLPEQISLERIKRREKYNKHPISSQSIFKDGMYAEHFVPLFIRNHRLYIGFSDKNCIEVLQGTAEFLQILKPFLKSNGNFLSEDPKDWLLDDRCLQFSIHKRQAIEFLQKWTKDPKEDKQSEACYLLLSKLRYSTQKQEILSQCFEQGKFKGHDSAFPKKDEFTLKIDISKKILNNTKGISGNLVLPAMQEWNQLFSAPFFQKLKSGDPLPENFEGKLCDFFQVPQNIESFHRKVRKVYSLPVLSDPSGGFRIYRKTPDDIGVYQVLAIDGNASLGFPITKDGIEINKNKAVPLREIENSPKVASLSSEPKTSLQGFVRYDAWLPLNDLSNLPEWLLGLELCPGSKIRMQLRLGIKAKNFEKLWMPLIKEKFSIKHPYLLPNSFQFSNEKKKAAKKLLSDLQMPRDGSKFWIIKLAKDSIWVEYIVSGTNNELRALYNQAYQEARKRKSENTNPKNSKKK